MDGHYFILILLSMWMISMIMSQHHWVILRHVWCLGLSRLIYFDFIAVQYTIQRFCCFRRTTHVCFWDVFEPSEVVGLEPVKPWKKRTHCIESHQSHPIFMFSPIWFHEGLTMEDVLYVCICMYVCMYIYIYWCSIFQVDEDEITWFLGESGFPLTSSPRAVMGCHFWWRSPPESTEDSWPARLRMEMPFV